MKNITATKWFTLVFGLFLGLAIWKFGNPVILDHVIIPPNSSSELLANSWPIHWANWMLLPLVVIGGVLIFQKNFFWPANRWLGLLPLGWLGWQFFSATETVDAHLTETTLWQFTGCVACYFLGALLFAREKLVRWLLLGVLAAFTFCLMRGVDQHLFEFPENRQMLIEGERTGWTNFPSETVVEMKTQHIIVTTNGVDVANPTILAKFTKGRAFGTLVYPNALAGIILLLLPVSLMIAFGATKNLKPVIRFSVITLAIFLGGAAFFWTGSKLGWLIGIGLAGFFLLRLDWPKKIKLATVVLVSVMGLGVFTVRFHNYFAGGATSVSARFDYWRAAIQTTFTHPLTGSGPGTFQRSYEHLKSSESEMARLTHNDYLEQFSDSGLVGGLTYLSWIFMALVVAGKTIWRSRGQISVAIFAGLLGWFVQGFGEFELYVPALSWTTFTLLGYLIGQNRNGFDKKSKNH